MFMKKIFNDRHKYKLKILRCMSNLILKKKLEPKFNTFVVLGRYIVNDLLKILLVYVLFHKSTYYNGFLKAYNRNFFE